MGNNEVIIEKSLAMLKDCNASNYNLSKRTGISEASIGNWKRGKVKPTLANSQSLINAIEKYNIEKDSNNEEGINNIEALH